MAVATPPRNFSWFIENKLAGLGYPTNEDMSFLTESGIKTLVNLTANSPTYNESATAHGITVHSINIQDFTPPTMSQIDQFLHIVVEEANSAVGVHCAMGRGRTGTMLACYLVSKEGYSPEEAISETRRRRRGSIETRTQEQAIRDFAEHKETQNT